MPDHNRLMPPENAVVHELPVRVYYEDTDAGGVVYHASYIRFCERGRTEMLRDNGIDHVSMFKETGVGFVVASLKVEYRQPALLDDLLTVRSWISRIGGASMEMAQHIYRKQELIAELGLTLVCIDRNMKAVRLPADVRALAGVAG